jgi:hypothetical protein
MSEENLIYIAIGPYVWGKGFSEEQALSALGKPRPKQYMIFTCTDPWAYVDGWGLIVRTRESTVVEVKRKGLKKEDPV